MLTTVEQSADWSNRFVHGSSWGRCFHESFDLTTWRPLCALAVTAVLCLPLDDVHARQCEDAEDAVYPVVIWLDHYAQRTQSNLFVKVREVAFDVPFEDFLRLADSPAERAFAAYVSALQRRDYAAAFGLLVPGVYENVEAFRPFADLYLSFDGLQDVRVIARVCLDHSDFFLWRASVDDPELSAIIFGADFQLGAQPKLLINHSNFVLPLVRDAYQFA